MIESIILFISLLYTFLVIWILGFLGHELCHILEGYRQGCTNGVIYINSFKGIPSMSCSTDGDPRYPRLILFSGGIYSGLIYLSLGLITSFAIDSYAFPLIFSFITLGIVNIFYGIYEGLFENKIPYETYMKYHYIVYFASVLLSIVLMGIYLIDYLKV